MTNYEFMRIFMNFLPDKLRTVLKSGIHEYCGINLNMPDIKIDPMVSRALATLLPEYPSTLVNDTNFRSFSSLIVSYALQKSVGSRIFIHPFHILNMLTSTGSIKLEASEWTKSVLMFESCLTDSFIKMKSALESNNMTTALSKWKAVRQESSFLYDAYKKKDTGDWGWSQLDPKAITEERLLEYYNSEISSHTEWSFGIDAPTVLRWVRKAIEDLKISRSEKDIKILAPNCIIPNDEDKTADIEEAEKDIPTAPISPEKPDWTKYAEKSTGWAACFGKYTSILTRWLPLACYLGPKNADLEAISKDTPKHYLLEKERYTKMNVQFLFEKGLMANDVNVWLELMTPQVYYAFKQAGVRAYYAATLNPIVTETQAEKTSLQSYYTYMAERLLELTKIELMTQDSSILDEFIKAVAEKGDPWKDIPMDEIQMKKFIEKGGAFDSFLGLAKSMISNNKEQLLDTAVSAASTVLPWGGLISSGYSAAKKFGLFDKLIDKNKTQDKQTPEKVKGSEQKEQVTHPSSLILGDILKKTVETKQTETPDALTDFFYTLFK